MNILIEIDNGTLLLLKIKILLRYIKDIKIMKKYFFEILFYIFEKYIEKSEKITYNKK